MSEKKDVVETVLTVIGIVAAVLIAAEWAFLYLLTSGVIKIT